MIVSNRFIKNNFFDGITAACERVVRYEDKGIYMMLSDIDGSAVKLGISRIYIVWTMRGVRLE